MSEPQLTRLTAAFIISRQAAGLSPRTVGFYQQQLSYFLTWLESLALPDLAAPDPTAPCPARPCLTKPGLTLNDLTAENIERYLAQRQTEVSPRSVHAAWRALRAFANWLHERRERYPNWTNPVPYVNGPKMPRTKVPAVERDVLRKMVKTCKGHDFFNDRDRAVLLVLASSGLRSCEFLELKQEDVNLSTGVLRVTRGKGGTSRMTIIDPPARLALADYLGHLIDSKPNTPLWNSQKGPLTYAGLVGLLHKRAALANVSAPSPHAFRRRWASDMVPKLGPWVVQALGGWADIESMKPYIQLSEQDLVVAYENRIK